MVLMASKRLGARRSKIYHRVECIHAKKIKYEYRVMKEMRKVSKKSQVFCSYCEGLHGEVNCRKDLFDWYRESKHVQITYIPKEKNLYVQTQIGFWRIHLSEEKGKYVLFHRNKFWEGLEFERAIRGGYHRQDDVAATNSLEQVLNYIVAHDVAKVTIQDDYRKLPAKTKKQRAYYRAAERRAKRNAHQRIDYLFSKIEKASPGIVALSVC